MFIYGKIIGALLGALMAGPIGLILGAFLGHFFDKGLALNQRFLSPDVELAKKVFFKTTFMIMGYIAKADGRVSENEIQMARDVMAELHIRGEQKMKAIEYFNLGKSAQFHWDEVMDNFAHNCGYHPQLIQLFIEIQLKAAFVDGIEHSQKQRVLEQICQKLNISPLILSQIESQFYAQRRHYQAPPPQYKKVDELAAAYQLLNVTAQSNPSQIKKAYRVMISQNHPDKLVSKGLPDEMIKVATEKTQRIQKAYELICRARGIK